MVASVGRNMQAYGQVSQKSLVALWETNGFLACRTDKFIYT